MDGATTTKSLLLWPSLLTLAISCVRAVGEVQGWLGTESGGRGLPVGITWCLFVFGGLFGWRLSRAGHGPRVRRAWLFAGLALIAAAATVVQGFAPLVGADRSEATFVLLRQAVVTAAIVTTALAVLMFRIWPRLAFVLLLYGLGARGTVLAITAVVKLGGWDTHYTKFGPPGIERDTLGETMLGAAIAQIGFWVPMTIVGGTFVGGLFARAGRT